MHASLNLCRIADETDFKALFVTIFTLLFHFLLLFRFIFASFSPVSLFSFYFCDIYMCIVHLQSGV